MTSKKRMRLDITALSDKEADPTDDDNKNIFQPYTTSSPHKVQLFPRPPLKKFLHPSGRLATRFQLPQDLSATGTQLNAHPRQEALNHLIRQLEPEALHPHDLLFPKDPSPSTRVSQTLLHPHDLVFPKDQFSSAGVETERQSYRFIFDKGEKATIRHGNKRFQQSKLKDKVQAATSCRNDWLAHYDYPADDEEGKFKSQNKTMTEPRARAARHKGQLNFPAELKSFLHAFGDNTPPLPETVRVLDEIVTDFIIETCHAAACSAQISKRQKIKLEDFNFAVRGNEVMLGRVREMLATDKTMKEMRRQFNTDEGKIGLERGGKKRKIEDGEEEEKGGAKKVKKEGDGEK